MAAWAGHSSALGHRRCPAPALCSSQGPSHGSRSRNSSSSSSHTCLPYPSAKGFLLERTQTHPMIWWLLPHGPFCLFFHPQGWPQCWKVDEDFPSGATQPLLTLLGAVPGLWICLWDGVGLLMSCLINSDSISLQLAFDSWDFYLFESQILQKHLEEPILQPSGGFSHSHVFPM